MIVTESQKIVILCKKKSQVIVTACSKEVS